MTDEHSESIIGAGRKHRETEMGRTWIVAALAGTMACRSASADVKLHYETGDLQGRQVTSGKFGSLISDRAMCRNTPNVPYPKTGKYYRSTTELSGGGFDLRDGGRRAEGLAACRSVRLTGIRPNEEAQMRSWDLGFTVVPPGPVTDKVRIELRAGIRNTSERTVTAHVTFHADRRIPSRLIYELMIAVPAGESRKVSAWWPTEGKAGVHKMLCRVEIGDGVRDAAWPVRVIECPSRALPYFQGAWIDGCGQMEPTKLGKSAVERELRLGVDAMHHLGINILIFTYPEWYGQFCYPSKIEFYDRDIKAISKGSSCTVDALGAVLSQAETNGQHVIVGIGRNGDLRLLWDFDKPDWHARNEAAIEVSRRIAWEIWKLYGRRKSFYGWYLTHEMNDLARSAAYYDPVALYCRSLSPEKPVLIAPAGTPIWTSETIAASQVDILAPQDGVGSGYVPYVNTWDPHKRIAMLEEVYSGYSKIHEGTHKHLWTDLEIWEMDGKSGYGNSYPPSFERVRKQIEIQRKHVDVLTAYAYFGFMQHPGRKAPGADPRAVRLYDDYVAYLKALPTPLRPGGF